MHIIDLKAVYPNYKHVAPSWRTHLWQIVVRVESDTGEVGFGYGGGGKAAVEIVNGHMRDLLVGRKLDGTERHLQRLGRAVLRVHPLRSQGRRGHGPERYRPRAVGPAGQIGGRARSCRHRAENEGDDSRLRDRRRPGVVQRDGLYRAQVPTSRDRRIG